MYKLNCEIYEKAKEIGLHIFESDNPKKKIEVYDEYGLFLYYVGNRNNTDYYVYRELENLNLIPIGTSNMKREKYYEKNKDKIEKGGFDFVKYYLLWK